MTFCAVCIIPLLWASFAMTELVDSILVSFASTYMQDFSVFLWSSLSQTDYINSVFEIDISKHASILNASSAAWTICPFFSQVSRNFYVRDESG